MVATDFLPSFFLFAILRVDAFIEANWSPNDQGTRFL